MEKRLFLIDGHALIFKMYYAFLRRPMINSKGADMSILFGFTKYILELIEKEKPTHFAVAFDPPGGTFRHEMYPDYKGTRSETPQLVIDSLEPLIGLCKAMNIPVLMVKGFEADDVIGTMAKKSEKEGYKVYMVTPDKDYGQLISENILQYKPGKGGSEAELVDRKGICEKYGISAPEQVIDLLTICGDTSDNVPGVKGVGEVGAGKLIAKYGSVSGIYSHINELTPKQKAAFEDAAGHIELSKTLVTIKTDVNIGIDADETAVNFDYSPEIADLFEKYEFSSLSKFIRHVKRNENAVVREAKKIETKVVTPEEFCRKAAMSGICGITPTYTGHGAEQMIKNLTAATVHEGKNLCAVGAGPDFRPILENPEIRKCGYDLKLLTNLLLKNGIELKGLLLDIELMHYLINSEKSHKIEILAKTYLDVDIQEHTEAAVPLSLFSDEETAAPENSRFTEAAASVLLCEKIAAELEKENLSDLYYKIEEPLIHVLAGMERTGVAMDIRQLRSFASELGMELDKIQEEIREMADEPQLNISSPKQIGVLLFEKLALDPKVKAKSGKRYAYSTDEETLSSIADKHPIVDAILEYRGVKKLLSTYIEPLPDFINPSTGKIHTTFNQALTSTGRLSSSKPNLQNIPVRTERGKEIRKAFVPSTPDGVIMSADYSQIELRIMAHLSCDSHLIEAFRHNIDVHAATAAKIFKIALEDVTPEQRRIAKTANFGIMYGISAFGLSQRLKIPRQEAKKIIDDYFENFPAVSAFINDTIISAKECGYVETLLGRRRYLPDINSRNATVRSLAERNAVNAPIQGTSADIIKMAMIDVDKELKERGLHSRMVLQIHDELLLDVTASEIETVREILIRKMENVIRLTIPLTVECNYGKNWLEAH